jgi:hypothetical protein
MIFKLFLMKKSKHLIIQAFLILFILVSYSEENQWLDIVKKEIEHLRIPYPQGTEYLIADIKSGANYISQNFPLKELENKMTENNFSDELKNKLRSIIWTETITFQGFTYSQMLFFGLMVEVAGVVRKLKNDVDLFYYVTQTISFTKPQKTTIKSKKCITIFGWQELYCWPEYKEVPRGLYINEINMISDAMKSKSYDAILELLNSQTNLLFLNNENNDSVLGYLSENYLLEKIKQEKDDVINTILETFKEDDIIKQVPQNASDFKNKIQKNHFYSIHRKDLEMFFETFVKNLNGIPENHTIFLEYLLKSLDESKISNISSLTFFITNDKKQLDLYNVFLDFDQDENRYCITVRNMMTNISIDTNILVFKLNDDNLKTLLHDTKRNGDYGEQFVALINLFEVACGSI